jgi:hypothetical protein
LLGDRRAGLEGDAVPVVEERLMPARIVVAAGGKGADPAVAAARKLRAAGVRRTFRRDFGSSP